MDTNIDVTTALDNIMPIGMTELRPNPSEVDKTY